MNNRSDNSSKDRHNRNIYVIVMLATGAVMLLAGIIFSIIEILGYTG